MELGPWTQSAVMVVTTGVAVAAGTGAFDFAPDVAKFGMLAENAGIALLVFGVRTVDIIRARREVRARRYYGG